MRKEALQILLVLAHLWQRCLGLLASRIHLWHCRPRLTCVPHAELSGQHSNDVLYRHSQGAWICSKEGSYQLQSARSVPLTKCLFPPVFNIVGDTAVLRQVANLMYRRFTIHQHPVFARGAAVTGIFMALKHSRSPSLAVTGVTLRGHHGRWRRWSDDGQRYMGALHGCII